MVNKRVSIFDNDNQKDNLDKVINNLNNISKEQPKDNNIERQPTVLDEYLEILRLRREIAFTLFKQYLIKLIQTDSDPALIEKASAMIGMYLGIGDRWSNDVLKNAINGEIGMYGGFVAKLMPDYIGDPIANFERSVSIGTKDDTTVLIANLLQLLGLNLSPETVDKLVKLFKDRLGNKQG